MPESPFVFSVRQQQDPSLQLALKPNMAEELDAYSNKEGENQLIRQVRQQSPSQQPIGHFLAETKTNHRVSQSSDAPSRKAPWIMASRASGAPARSGGSGGHLIVHQLHLRVFRCSGLPRFPFRLRPPPSPRASRLSFKSATEEFSWNRTAEQGVYM
ncbi:hypothetical protein PAHAL_6G265900 [Panicum hallii]|jgi:hypothetical protein|uniref:Uncharacterized protein n=1 Tax=Panicum hallii TaxID=206008 RepID=A0A2S3I3U8_9POAL|nr:hypothetical protein PAHAL_6G265900 [Panicum hallii]